jgi:DNA-binding XRE family transcriptional regulator
MQDRKYNDIVSRVEEVRNHLGLNKSKFATQIGLKPQTYNNFIAAQGSKPNVALILGVVEAFGVNAHWLLNGLGSTFRTPQQRNRSGSKQRMIPDEIDPLGAWPPADEITTLRVELEMLLRPFRGGSTPMLHRDALHHTQVQMAIQMLKHLFQVAPVETTVQVIQMLDEFQRIAGEMELARRNQPQVETED